MATVAENSKRLDDHDKDINELRQKVDEYRMEQIKQFAKIESKLDYQDKTLIEVRDDVKVLIRKPAEAMSKFNWIIIGLAASAIFALVWTNLIN